MEIAADEAIRHLEALCIQLYKSTDPAQRAEAVNAIANFQNAPDALEKCQILLERENSSYSKLLATSTLTKLVSQPIVSLEQRLQIRKYVFTYVKSRPNLDSFVVQALLTLIASITKLGWLDKQNNEFVFRNVISEAKTLVQGSLEEIAIGVQLLCGLTAEMNKASGIDSYRSLATQKKISVLFREQELVEIFELCCALLRSCLDKPDSVNLADSVQATLMKQLLQLANSCLVFNFSGALPDESSAEHNVLQVSKIWKPTFLNVGTMQLFFDLYDKLPSSLSSLSLSCLVQIASVRRSLFTNSERIILLTTLIRGINCILKNAQGLNYGRNYHEFCRLLATLKTHYQVAELVLVKLYPEAIQLITKFTVDSFEFMLQTAPNSVHYLLSLWQKLVASVPYVKVTEAHLLETFAPQVTRAFIKSRINSVTTSLREGVDDPLDDSSLVHQQMEQFSIIGRCEYKKTCELVAQLFDQSARKYQELILLQSNNPSTTVDIDLAIEEGHLSWLVQLIGAGISGRSFHSAGANQEHDSMDGELVCRVLQLMQFTDSRLSKGGSEHLELAFLIFLEKFRRIYLGDPIVRITCVYHRITAVFGLSDEILVLGLFMKKIITNLKYWSACEEISSKTLTMLNELTIGYKTVKQLVKLEEVQFLLNNHTNEYFPTMGRNQNVSDLKNRAVFYTALTRILVVELGDDEYKFDLFMTRLSTQIQAVLQMFMTPETAPYLSVPEMKWSVIGLARDLRGIVFALNLRGSYMLFLDWIFPAYTPIFQRAMKLWYHDPQVSTSVLKLFAEMVQNRSGRLNFDVCSPNGVLLFREASTVICCFGDSILTVDVPKEQLYNIKLKGISTCFAMLKFALCGQFVNFGVLRLYNDETLDNVLNCFLKLLASVSLSDLMSYPKLARNYYTLLEIVAQDHMNFLSLVDSNTLLYILSSISEGLANPDAVVCPACCSSLDHIVTYIFKQSTRKNQKATRLRNQNNDKICQAINLHPEALQELMSIILNMLMFEECQHQWVMSKPLLGLLLLNEQYFGELRQQIIAGQPSEGQPAMTVVFDALTVTLERNLSTKSRDKFARNLDEFRRHFKELLIGQAPNSTDCTTDMMSGTSPYAIDMTDDFLNEGVLHLRLNSNTTSI